MKLMASPTYVVSPCGLLYCTLSSFSPPWKLLNRFWPCWWALFICCWRIRFSCICCWAICWLACCICCWFCLFIRSCNILLSVPFEFESGMGVWWLFSISLYPSFCQLLFSGHKCPFILYLTERFHTYPWIHVSITYLYLVSSEIPILKNNR